MLGFPRSSILLLASRPRQAISYDRSLGRAVAKQDCVTALHGGYECIARLPPGRNGGA